MGLTSSDGNSTNSFILGALRLTNTMLENLLWILAPGGYQLSSWMRKLSKPVPNNSGEQLSSALAKCECI